MISRLNQGCKIWLLLVNYHINRDGHVTARSKHDRMSKCNDTIIDALIGPQRRPVLVVRWITHIDLKIVSHDLKFGHEHLPLRYELAQWSASPAPFFTLALKGRILSCGEGKEQPGEQLAHRSGSQLMTITAATTRMTPCRHEH